LNFEIQKHFENWLNFEIWLNFENGLNIGWNSVGQKRAEFWEWSEFLKSIEFWKWVKFSRPKVDNFKNELNFKNGRGLDWNNYWTKNNQLNCMDHFWYWPINKWVMIATSSYTSTAMSTFTSAVMSPMFVTFIFITQTRLGLGSKGVTPTFYKNKILPT
jgi:hypothetical protein